MQVTIQHEKYGTITYSEKSLGLEKEFWFNQTLLIKKERNVYVYKPDENTEITVKARGEYLTGVTLTVDGEKIIIVPVPTWYEVACSLFIFILLSVWGNIKFLFSIIPVLFGVIGVCYASFFALINFYLMKKIKAVWMKWLLWLVVLAGSFSLSVLLGYVILFMTAP